MTSATTGTIGLQTNTRRLELYIRISLYVILACLPLGIISAASGGRPGVVVVATPALAVGSIFACRWALSTMRPRPVGRGTPWPWLIAFAALALTVLGWLLIETPELVAWPSAMYVALGCPLAAVVVLVRPVVVAGCCVGSGLGIGAVASLRAGWDFSTSAGLAVGITVVMAFLLYTFWLSGWMLRVVWELADARARAAELAIAEERLRISRDLHDLFGRTLAAVALKSELAAELLRRGQAEPAAAEIEAVRLLADASGKEVRQVVHGYRDVGLDVELVGARALLDSAGIRCAVRGEVPQGLDPQVASAFGWILREAVTNVIRHSRAQECLITLDADHDLHLVVTNDGAESSSPTDRPGKGLLGMAERLDAVGGTLGRDLVGDRYTVIATAPVQQPASSGARR